MKSLVQKVVIGMVLGMGNGAVEVLANPAIATETPQESLAKMVDRANQMGPRAGYLFDLDETLVDSTPRRYFSLLDAVDVACQVPNPPADCDAVGGDHLRLKDIYRLQNRYDDQAYLRMEGAKDPAFIDSVVKSALSIYLSGRYIVEEDRLYPGVLGFIRALKDAGANVFFSSARSTLTQRGPTLEFLRRRGLIAEGEEDHLYTKDGTEPSVDFKRTSAVDVGSRMDTAGGRVVGIFENEPENISVWSEVLPGAKPFFVEGAYMKNGPIPARSVLLQDFRY